MPGWFFVLVIGWYLALSVVSTSFYVIDKRRAIQNRSGAGKRRIPERTLHLVDLLGGWPGGLTARQLFRHKRDKRVKARFVWTSRAIVAIHAMVWILAALLL
jgi:uncharacterized membrane protein YsdA (DUF1294 family)